MVNWSQGSNSHSDPSPSSIPCPAAPRFGASSISLDPSQSRQPVGGTARSYGYPTWYDRRSNDAACGDNVHSPPATPSSIPMARSQANRPAQTSSRRLTRTAKQPVSLLPAPTALPSRPSPGPLSFPGATAPTSSIPRMAGSRSAPLTPIRNAPLLPAADTNSARTVRPVQPGGILAVRSVVPAPQSRPPSERSSTLRAVEKATLKLSALAMGRTKAPTALNHKSGPSDSSEPRSASEQEQSGRRKTLQRQSPVRTVRKPAQSLVDLPPSVPLFPADQSITDKAPSVPVFHVDEHVPVTVPGTRKSSASSAGPMTPIEPLSLPAAFASDARSNSTPDLVSSRAAEPTGRLAPARRFSRPVCPATRIEPRNYDLSAFRVEYRCPSATTLGPQRLLDSTSRPSVDLVPELTQRQHAQPPIKSIIPCPSNDQSRISRPRPQKVIPPPDALNTTRQALVPLHHLVRVIAVLPHQQGQNDATDRAALPTVDEVEEAVEAFLAAERERVFRTGKWDAVARSRASWLLEQLEALVSRGVDASVARWADEPQLPDVSLKYPVHQAIRRLGISLPDVPPPPAAVKIADGNDVRPPPKTPFMGWSYV